jgi:glycerol-3-phosphate acyltransferase PlsY
MDTVSTFVAIALTAYLVGSIPFAYLVGRWGNGIDLRLAGEGNVGARNVFHVVGPGWGITVFFLDATKGAAVGLALRNLRPWQLAVGGVAVVVGHALPVWLGFLGGKGVATASGFFTALFPVAALLGGVAAGAAFAGTRRFLPTTVVAIVVALVSAAALGGSMAAWAIAVSLFVLAGLKRALDEPRMRRVEASTRWNRATGGTTDR